MSSWGIVSTIKAPLPRILDFAAWHLELGADHLFLYLDQPDPEARKVLNAHPAITVTETDHAYWEKKGGRPDAHQNRQCRNARHANNRKTGLRWLAHIDVDEFLLPDGDLADILSTIPEDALCARIRPVEALARSVQGETDIQFKGFHLDQSARQEASTRIFGSWAQHLSGGFLSHVAGKLFFRAGTKGLQIRIHNVVLDGQRNPGQVALQRVMLGHFHAASWEAFRDAYRFRLSQGSYRAGLNPQARGKDAMKLHDLFHEIEAAEGEAGLKRFYEDVATATPELTAKLDREGLLHRRKMDLPALVARHFPGHDSATKPS